MMENSAKIEPKTYPPLALGTSEPLPYLYFLWINAIIKDSLPVETEASCGDCVMCPGPEESVNSEQEYFDSSSKCCTYTPTLSNFMVGAILNDTNPAMKKGKATLETRLSKGLGVGPFAIKPPPAYTLLYQHSQKAFGRNGALRCPHLDTATGECTIWPYRDPTCVTWFCKHLRGKLGQSFWKALQIFLNAITKELSLWCALKLNLGDDALALLEARRKRGKTGESLQANELDGRFDVDLARNSWGRWWQHETAFYAECARLVSDLDFKKVEEICGPEVRMASRLVKLAYARLQNPHIPTHLKIGQLKVEHATFDAIRVWSYSPLDPLDLPIPVFMALCYFDGRPTSDVLSMVQHDLGISLDDQELRTLIDFGILETTTEPVVGSFSNTTVLSAL